MTLPTPKPRLIAERSSHKFQELTEILPLGLMVPSLYKASRDDFLRNPIMRGNPSTAKSREVSAHLLALAKVYVLGIKDEVQSWGRKTGSASPAHQ